MTASEVEEALGMRGGEKGTVIELETFVDFLR